MKIFSVALLLMATLAVVLLGCSDNSAPIASANEQVAPTTTSPGNLAKGGVVHSVTGSANTYSVFDPAGYIWPGPKQKGGFYNVVTVNAIDQGNGIFSGRFINQFQGKLPAEQAYGFCAKVEAKVIHLVVDGNKALVVAEITSWKAPDGTPPLPWWLAQVFIDNGEGGPGGSPDETGGLWASPDPADKDLWIGMSPQDYLDWMMIITGPLGWGPTYPVDHGNIQVR
jgi:hypothetical protein